MPTDKIAVIDFGGQYAHLIATKVRRRGVLAEIRQPEDPTDAFREYKGIIISGSPSFSSQEEDSSYNKGIYDLELPILGFCFGHQEIAKHYGAEIIQTGREWGKADLHVDTSHPLFKGLEETETVWMSHFDSVMSLGPDFRELGYTVPGSGIDHRFAVIASDKHRRYGFQFHPEVDDTVHGEDMIANFVLEICGCTPSWSMTDFLDDQIERLTQQIGDRSVFMLVSGGVDSTVAAAIIGKAIGPERLSLLHIDNGLMRKDESRQVLEMFERLDVSRHLAFVDASDRFLAALAGVADPERKRTIIGATFIDVFKDEANRLDLDDHLLGQGTIYPDTIETGGTKRSDTIKTHHNRVPVVEEMIAAGRVVEPLAELYKVEVRELGEKLGIPHDMLWRHPFPGPGLGVRLLCHDGAEEDDVAAAQAEVESQALGTGIDPVVLPIKSVGVKADLRVYEHPVLLTGTADWDDLLALVSTITAEVTGINRCIWNLTSEPLRRPYTAKAYTTRKRADLLREADHLVMTALQRYGLYEAVWQCPTVLVPVWFEGVEGELVVLRPIRSERAMTATPVELPPAMIAELSAAILALDGIGAVALDVTSKPPSTIEWE